LQKKLSVKKCDCTLLIKSNSFMERKTEVQSEPSGKKCDC